jgi:hypothetical protein
MVIKYADFPEQMIYYICYRDDWLSGRSHRRAPHMPFHLLYCFRKPAPQPTSSHVFVPGIRMIGSSVIPAHAAHPRLAFVPQAKPWMLGPPAFAKSKLRLSLGA